MRVRVIFILFYLIKLGGEEASAQMHWKRVDSLYGPLPTSIHIFRSEDTLEGHPLIAYYADVFLKDNDIFFTTRGETDTSYTPSKFYQLEKFPILLVNCSFFSAQNYQNLSLLIKKGRMLSQNVVSLRGTGDDSLLYYYPTRSAFGLDKKRRPDIAWIFNDSTHRRLYAFEDGPVIAKGSKPNPSINSLRNIEWKWWAVKTAVGGGPTLVHDGLIMITSKEEQMYPGQENEKTARTALGYTTGSHLIILLVQGGAPDVSDGASLRQEAKMLKDLGCEEAMNLNGGGSSCMLINGKETIRPSDKEGERPIPGIFMVKWTGRED
jgi:hypothetical protein